MASRGCQHWVRVSATPVSGRGWAAGRRAMTWLSRGMEPSPPPGGFVFPCLHPGTSPLHSVAPAGPASKFARSPAQRSRLVQPWSRGDLAGLTSYHLWTPHCYLLSDPHLLPLLVVKPCKQNPHSIVSALLEDVSKYNAGTKAKSCLSF